MARLTWPRGLRHPWPGSARDAIALQRRLRTRLRIAGGPQRIRTVAGADIAYDAAAGYLFAAVLVYSFPDLQLLERRIVRRAIRFPYIPGLLSFREAPALVQACRRLRIRPDLLICDGQGIAHPRGIGLASHVGLLLDLPTVGCAKSRLIGEHRPPGARRGSMVPLTIEGRRIGCVIRTRTGVRPLFISPGHRIGIEAAARCVLRCCRRFRLPEPVRQADRLVGLARRGLSRRTPLAISKSPRSL